MQKRAKPSPDWQIEGTRIASRIVSGEAPSISLPILPPIKIRSQKKGTTHGTKTSCRRDYFCNGADLANGHDVVGRRIFRFPPYTVAGVLKRPAALFFGAAHLLADCRYNRFYKVLLRAVASRIAFV